MSSLSKEAILSALREVIDPDTGKNVVDSGMMQGLVVRNGNVGFSLEVDPAEGAQKEPLRKACEDRLIKLKGLISVTAVLTAHRSAEERAEEANQSAPVAPAAPQKKRAAPPPSLGIPGVKAIIAIASGKGGVGKSTVAVNIALALSQLGMKIGLLDADIYGPSIPMMMGLSGKPETTEDKKLIPMENHGIKTMSIGCMVEPGTAMIWRGPMVQSALQQMMMDVKWGELDLLVVDMPPGTGDAQLTMAQKVPLAGAVIVSTPQDIALLDAVRGIAMFEKTNIPILGLVENMAWFEAPGSNEKTYIFGQGGVKRTAEKMGKDLLGEVPLVPAIREGMDQGKPIVAQDPNSPTAAPFIAIAKKLKENLEAQSNTKRDAPNITIS
ncbi:MAG: Mrp/NBP35 family ATP-binding protein [Parvibaculaceae bacterium]|nr:Mrp/NBP35 family ATP-binding protein [Parvibaculaceae bacterium]